MADASRNSQQLATLKLDRSVFKFNGETPLKDQECLVGVGMKVPVIRLCHCGNSDNMIIGMSNGMIVVTKIGWRLDAECDDVGNRSAHS